MNCRHCKTPLKTTGSECENCESDRRDGKSPAADPLTIYRAAVFKKLDGRDCNPQQIWEQALADLPGIIERYALSLTERRRPSKSGVPGIDYRPGRGFRARVWKGGKCIWCRSFITLERAIAAREKFIAECAKQSPAGSI